MCDLDTDGQQVQGMQAYAAQPACELHTIYYMYMLTCATYLKVCFPADTSEHRQLDRE